MPISSAEAQRMSARAQEAFALLKKKAKEENDGKMPVDLRMTMRMIEDALPSMFIVEPEKTKQMIEMLYKVGAYVLGYTDSMEAPE